MTQKPNDKSRGGRGGKSEAPSAPNFLRRHPKWTAAALLAGAGLLGSAIFNRAAARRAEARTPPAGKFIHVDGTKLHFLERGEGQPVVLLHGNGVLLQDFEASGVLDLIANKHRVIAFDRPGFGYSDRPQSTIWTPSAQADLIARAMSQMGVRGAVVVGHSWGTLVALAMALDHPDAVAGLVLLSGYYYGTARPDVLPLSAPAIPLIGDVMAHTISPLAGALMGPAAVKAAFAPAEVAQRFVDFPIAITLRPSQVRATAADTAMMVPSAVALSRRYRDLGVPTIILAGEGDLIVGVEKHSKRLAGEVEGSELRVLAEQGHLFHYAEPSHVATAVDDVLERVGSS
ncbi:alpha/beta fold hydrolase [Sphingomonas changbaiensis]|nr:alpha/beta hydrolase [Sphingomonas changbaiensis]